MDAVLFDVDDTLYDQREPFERAFRQLFGETYEIDMERLFALSESTVTRLLNIPRAGR